MKNHIRMLAVIMSLVLFLMACRQQQDISDVSISAHADETQPTEIVSVGDIVSDPEEALEEVTVPVLMFHDVKTVAGGTWSMSADNFRKTMVFLLDNGYTPVSFDQLVDYVDGVSDIPEKPVGITLDDGYFINYRNVLPIVTELEVPVTVFMSCKTVREEGVTPDLNEKALHKMSAAELSVMEASPYVQIQSHTYGLHGVNTSYSEAERDNSMPLETESESEYKGVFAKDCELAEGVLSGVGVSENTVFSYPSGKYNEWAEDVLKERGYRVSLTTNYGHNNRVVKGDKESLFLLGRMNVNDDTTEEALLKYLTRE